MVPAPFYYRGATRIYCSRYWKHGSILHWQGKENNLCWLLLVIVWCLLELLVLLEFSVAYVAHFQYYPLFSLHWLVSTIFPDLGTMNLQIDLCNSSHITRSKNHELYIMFRHIFLKPNIFFYFCSFFLETSAKLHHLGYLPS